MTERKARTKTATKANEGTVLKKRCSVLVAQGDEDFGGGDYLAYMALSVVGYVD